MYPSKNNMTSEINRLFSRNPDHDSFNSPITPNMFNQSTGRSSSSTDTSPETFPEMAPHRYPELYQAETLMETRSHRSDQFDNNNHFRLFSTPDSQRYELAPRTEVPNTFNQIHETPYVVRHQRPIVGRKLMTTPEYQAAKIEESTWPEEFLQQTPPSHFQAETKRYYELFPAEKKGFEFKTPSKISPKYTPPKMQADGNVSPKMGSYQSTSKMTASPNMTNMSPVMTNMSPVMTNMSPVMTNMSPRMLESPTRNTPPYSPRYPSLVHGIKEPLIPCTIRPNTVSKMCTFCRKNGETPLVYMTHAVKEKVDHKHVVTCPILRSHVCSTCGASGDNAHTITYCPVLRDSNNGKPLESTTITLKNTRIKSNGRRRF